MNPEVAKKRQLLIDTLKANGWEQDRFGHFQKLRTFRSGATGLKEQKLYRVKMCAISCRVEVRWEQGGRWLRIGGDYYTNIREIDGFIYVGCVKLGKLAPTVSA